MSYATRPGVGWMRHLPPLHRSARVSGPEPVRLSPNAVQTVRAGQATPARKISWPPLRLGVAWTLQVWPFHRSASVLAGVWFPTAVHAVAEVQDTPLRPALGPAGAGLKVGTICHVRPFHRSASVPSDSPVAGSNSLPTAMQDDRDVQASYTPRWNGMISPRISARGVGLPPLIYRMTSGSLLRPNRLSTSSSVNRRSVSRPVCRKMCIHSWSVIVNGAGAMTAVFLNLLRPT